MPNTSGLTRSYHDRCKYIECGAQLSSGKFIRNHVTTLDKIGQFRHKHDNTNVYTTIYTYDQEDQKEALLYAPFYLDLDYEATPEGWSLVQADCATALKYMQNVLRVETSTIKIYFSGNKGIHLIIHPEILGIVPSKDLNILYKMLADDIASYTQNNTIDNRIYDRKRLLRMPNSKHGETGLYKIPLTVEEVRTISFDEVRTLAKQSRKFNHSPPTPSPQAQMIINGYRARLSRPISKKHNEHMPETPLDVTPPCMEYILNNTINKGKRDNTAIALSSFFHQRGFSIEEARARLMEWGMEQCSPPLNEVDIDRIITQAYEQEYKYGCTTIKDLGYCEGKKCALRRKKD